MVRGLDHIGIIVRDLTRAIDQYQSALGLSVTRIEDYGEGLLTMAFLPIPAKGLEAAPQIELLQPHRPNCSAWRFLEEKGEGIEHLAFRTDSIDNDLTQMILKGIPLWDQSARPGAEGTRIAFIDPAGLSGCLVELVELISP